MVRRVDMMANLDPINNFSSVTREELVQALRMVMDFENWGLEKDGLQRFQQKWYHLLKDQPICPFLERLLKNEPS